MVYADILYFIKIEIILINASYKSLKSIFGREDIMKRFFVFIISLIFFCMCLLSCKTESTSAEEMLSSIMAKSKGLPAGEIYFKGASEGEKGYFSPSLCASMYGEKAYDMLAFVEDYAIYMSSVQAPYEIAVFECFSSTDAEKIGTLCLERAEILRVLLGKTEWRALVDSASVNVSGRTVIMTVTEN